jgi:hypothetical protein
MINSPTEPRARRYQSRQAGHARSGVCLVGEGANTTTVTFGRLVSRFTAGFTATIKVSICAGGGWTLMVILR